VRWNGVLGAEPEAAGQPRRADRKPPARETGRTAKGRPRRKPKPQNPAGENPAKARKSTGRKPARNLRKLDSARAESHALRESEYPPTKPGITALNPPRLTSALSGAARPYRAASAGAPCWAAATCTKARSPPAPKPLPRYARSDVSSQLTTAGYTAPPPLSPARPRTRPRRRQIQHFTVPCRRARFSAGAPRHAVLASGEPQPNASAQRPERSEGPLKRLVSLAFDFFFIP
jgi:hypothetical protein